MGISIEVNSDKTYTVDVDLPPGVSTLDAVRILADTTRRYIDQVYPPELRAKARDHALAALVPPLEGVENDGSD